MVFRRFYTKEEPLEGNSQAATGPPDEATDLPLAGPDLELERRNLALAQQDPRHFEFFFGKYHRPLFRFIHYKTGDFDRAGQLTGEVFLRALEGLHRYRWRGHALGAWLFRIARTVVAADFEQRRRRQEVAFDLGLHGRAAPDDPQGELERANEAELLRRCLARLGDPRQDVFILHYWQELSVSQVAVALELPEGTVKTHLQRGRRQLATMLENEGLERLSAAGRRALQELAARESGLRLVEDPDAEPADDERR